MPIPCRRSCCFEQEPRTRLPAEVHARFLIYTTATILRAFYIHRMNTQLLRGGSIQGLGEAESLTTSGRWLVLRVFGFRTEACSISQPLRPAAESQNPADSWA